MSFNARNDSGTESFDKVNVPETMYQPLDSVTEIEDHVYLAITSQCLDEIEHSASVETILPNQTYLSMCVETDRVDHAYSAINELSPDQKEHSACVKTVCSGQMYQSLVTETDRDIHSYSEIVDQAPCKIKHCASVETCLPDQMYQPLCVETDRDDRSYSTIANHSPVQIEHHTHVQTVLFDQIDQSFRSQMDINDHMFLETLYPFQAEKNLNDEKGYKPVIMTYLVSSQERQNDNAETSEDSYIAPIGQSLPLAEQDAKFGTVNEYAYITMTKETSDQTDQHQTMNSGAGEKMDVREHAYLEILNYLPAEQIVTGKQRNIPMRIQASDIEEQNVSAETSEYSYITSIGQSSSRAQQGANFGTEGNDYTYITAISEPSDEAEHREIADTGAGEYTYITPISYPLGQANQRQQSQNTGCKTNKGLVVALLVSIIIVLGVTLGLWYFLSRDIPTELVSPTMIPRTEIATESATPNTGQTTELSAVSSDADLSTKSNRSTFEFVVIFSKPIFHALSVMLMIYSSQTGSLQIKGISKSIDQNITLKEGKNIINLPEGVYLDDLNGKQNKTLRIISSGPFDLSVVSKSGSRWYQDGYYVIPKPHLSTQYIVPTFTVSHRYDRSLIGITSLETPSKVNISVRTTNTCSSVSCNGKKYYNGQLIKLNLAPYESLQVSHDYDLSGTTITATSPIAVMAGNRCGTVIMSRNCNHFIENILPVDQQDTEFIVPLIQNRPTSVVRVYSYYQNNVSIFSNNSVINKVIEPEGWNQFLHNNVSYITATSNLLVIIYPSQTYKYSSFMMTIHGKKQYKSEYVFVVPRRINDDDTTYLSFSLYGNDTAGFEMDGKPLIVSSVFTTTIEGKMISSFVNEVAPGAHKVINTDKHSFGLWVYGNVRYSGYGLPAGIYFN